MPKEKRKADKSKENRTAKRPAEPETRRPDNQFSDYHQQVLQRVVPNPSKVSPSDILALTRVCGNRSIQRLLSRRQSRTGGFDLDDNMARRINRARSGGQPLGRSLQKQMTAHMGYNFSGVRVHIGPNSDELNRQLSAKAFTTGQDIFFRHGAYNTASASGRALIAHELSHVVQQSSGRIPSSGGAITVRPADDPFEREAETMARRVALGDHRRSRNSNVADWSRGGGIVQRLTDISGKNKSGNYYATAKDGKEIAVEPYKKGQYNCHGFTFGCGPVFGFSPLSTEVTKLLLAEGAKPFAGADKSTGGINAFGGGTELKKGDIAEWMMSSKFAAHTSRIIENKKIINAGEGVMVPVKQRDKFGIGYKEGYLGIHSSSGYSVVLWRGLPEDVATGKKTEEGNGYRTEQ